MGIYICSGLASLLGGVVVGLASGQENLVLPLVGAIRPWQVVFFAVGLPGVLLSVLLLTVREPVRRGVHMRRSADGKLKASAVPTSEVVAYFKRNWQTLLCHNLGFALLSFSSYGSGAWIPTFLIRNHGYSARDAGIYYGLIVMAAGTLGIVFGGYLADRFSSRGLKDAKMRAGLFAALVWFPFGILYPLVGEGSWALLLLVPTVFTASMPFGSAPAAIQEMMPNPLRAQASAVYLFVVNLIGLGLGPTVVALFTDYVFAEEQAVRYSLMWVGTLAHLGSGLLLWLGLRPFRRSVELVEQWQPGS
jgi:MFS family permease